jgi:hypothetical protein
MRLECRSSLPSFLLAAYPVPDVGSAIHQLDALFLAGDEEAHDGDIHKRHIVQVEDEPWAVLPDLGLEFVQILRLDATDEPEGGGLAVERRFDPKRHCGYPRNTGAKQARAAPWLTPYRRGQLASAMLPLDRQLPIGGRV